MKANSVSFSAQGAAFQGALPSRTNSLRAIRGGRFAALVALAVLGLLFTAAGAKAAGCAAPYKAGAAPSIPFVSPQPDDSSNPQDAEQNFEPRTIVGLWHLVYTATSATAGPLPVPVIPPGPPDSFQFIQSYKTWHADGTEFENAFLPPAGGNVCFGVWKDLGRGSVKLHHIGLMFSPEGAVSNVFTVDETDTVAANGKTYTGTFDFKIFEPTDVLGTGAVLQEIKGTTAGTRITVD
jgi:hypothetical protein